MFCAWRLENSWQGSRYCLPLAWDKDLTVCHVWVSLRTDESRHAGAVKFGWAMDQTRHGPPIRLACNVRMLRAHMHRGWWIRCDAEMYGPFCSCWVGCRSSNTYDAFVSYEHSVWWSDDPEKFVSSQNPSSLVPVWNMAGIFSFNSCLQDSECTVLQFDHSAALMYHGARRVMNNSFRCYFSQNFQAILHIINYLWMHFMIHLLFQTLHMVLIYIFFLFFHKLLDNIAYH